MREKFFRKLIVFSSIGYFIFIIFMSIFTQSSIDLVFVGFSPFLLYIMLFFVLMIYSIMNYWVWIAPLVFPILMYFAGLINEQVAVLNVLICYLYNGIVFYVLKVDTQKKVVKYVNKIEHQEKLKLRSIEDKCKAINFVIGRVYSDKRGGNSAIRKKLKINKEYYNKVSESVGEERKKALNQIYFSLLNFEVDEKEILDKKIYGGKIIDILAKVDKDPIREYVSEAKEICVRLLKQ